MVTEFARADLIICRAGATTSAELVAAGKAAIMIPFPLAADDHQRKNAEALQTAGAARMILQKDLNGTRLAAEISSLIEAPDEIDRMETTSRKLARRDAAAAAVDLIEEVIQRRGGAKLFFSICYLTFFICHLPDLSRVASCDFVVRAPFVER